MKSGNSVWAGWEEKACQLERAGSLRNEFKLDEDGVRRGALQAVPDRQEDKGLEAAGKIWGASWENSELGPLGGSIGMQWIQILVSGKAFTSSQRPRPTSPFSTDSNTSAALSQSQRPRPTKKHKGGRVDPQPALPHRREGMTDGRFVFFSLVS